MQPIPPLYPFGCVRPLFFNMQDPKLPGQCGQEDFDKVIRNYRVMKHEVKTWNQAPPFDMLQMLFDVGTFYKNGEIFGK